MSNYQYFSIDDCIRGYHIYKDIWTAPIGEYLACKPEFGNLHDPYALAVVTTNDVTVGHLFLDSSSFVYCFTHVRTVLSLRGISTNYLAKCLNEFVTPISATRLVTFAFSSSE